jgi:hypothetical protein
LSASFPPQPGIRLDRAGGCSWQLEVRQIGTVNSDEIPKSVFALMTAVGHISSTDVVLPRATKARSKRLRALACTSTMAASSICAGRRVIYGALTESASDFASDSASNTPSTTQT